MIRPLALTVALLVGSGTAGAAPEQDACVEPDVKANLDAKRKRRETQDRLFPMNHRHEIVLSGGAFVSDVFDATSIAGGAYAYHMTEDFAVEASAATTRFVSTGGPELERTFSVLQGRSKSAHIFEGDLVWSPLHAKLRSGGSIRHFDVYLAAGGGIVDSELSSGVAGNVALGVRFFLGRAFSLRFEVRDRIYKQQLLARHVLVQDLAATLGLSVFLPLSPASE